MRPSHFLLTGFCLLMIAVTATANLGYARDFFGSVTTVPMGIGDKIGHAVLFGILGLLANLASPQRSSWRATLVVALAATVDEASQHFFSHRSCDLVDLVASLSGIAIGAAIAAAVARRASLSKAATTTLRPENPGR